MKYVLFDLETEQHPGPLNLDRHIPGITIGATLTGSEGAGRAVAAIAAPIEPAPAIPTERMGRTPAVA